MKKETTTSSFGVSKRENHNSDKFYSSNLYDGIIIHEAEDKTINFLNEDILGNEYRKCETSKSPSSVPRRIATSFDKFV